MKIKSALMIALVLFTGTLCAQEIDKTDSFTIEIKIPEKNVVRHVQLNGEDRSMEVMKMTDKVKLFSGTVSSYGLYTLVVEYYDDKVKKNEFLNIPLFIVPGYTEIVFGENSPIIKINGESARPRFEYAMLVQDDEAYISRSIELEKKLKQAEKTGTRQQILDLHKKISAAEEDRSENLYAKFVHNNPKSPMALYAMTMYAGMVNNPLAAEALLNSMRTDQMNTPRMIALRKRIEKDKTTMVGAMAPEFSQSDTSGNALALKDLQGQFVLVDFWASWCKPCRVQNPDMVKLYQKYNKKGFTILGVSLDSKKSSWVMAICQDKLSWHHVSDLHFWNNEVAKLYSINSVPQNFLIDPTGKIIAKNLSEDELDVTLDEALKNRTTN